MSCFPFSDHFVNLYILSIDLYLLRNHCFLSFVFCLNDMMSKEGIKFAFDQLHLLGVVFLKWFFDCCKRLWYLFVVSTLKQIQKVVDVLASSIEESHCLVQNHLTLRTFYSLQLLSSSVNSLDNIFCTSSVFSLSSIFILFYLSRVPTCYDKSLKIWTAFSLTRRLYRSQN